MKPAQIDEGDLLLRVRHFMPGLPPGSGIHVHLDTTDFFKIEYGDVVILAERPYLIGQNAKEGRFGLDDEVKHWVKRARDLESGQRVLLKLVFYEKFMTTVGGICFECFRSPKKEARILELVRGHPNFMQGRGVQDEKGNTVRILEHIYGKPLPDHVLDLEDDHEAYFFNHLPGILDLFLESIEGIRFLHRCGEKHGDIRRDHLLLDYDTGRYRWIDFDYNYRHRENIYGYDLFGIGNILCFLVGKGDVTLQDLRRNHPALPRIGESDLNIVFRNRVANLKKVYPYIPDSLNRVLLHFSTGAQWFYDTTDPLIEDLREARRML